MTRYVPLSQRDEEGQPIRYQRPSRPSREEDDMEPDVVDSTAPVPGRPTSKQRVIPPEQTQHIRSNQLPRVFDGHIGNVPVKIINLPEMLKTTALFVLLIVVVIAFTVTWQKWRFESDAGSYDYIHYRQAIHATNAPCRLDGSAKAVDQNGTVVVCAESGNKPAKDQINQWQGYLEWQACYEFGDYNMCNQLSN